MATFTNVHLIVMIVCQSKRIIIIMVMIIIILIMTGRTVCLPCYTCRTSRPCHQLLRSLTGGHQDDFDDDYDDEEDDKEDDEEDDDEEEDGYDHPFFD